MPKVGMEPVRRKALVDAALKAIGDHGTLSVSMQEIARSAGVSPALAFHYFGSKDQLLLATMRSLLKQLTQATIRGLSAAQTPRARVSAIIGASLEAEQFTAATISAWLAFYVEAQRSSETRRLLTIYASRLNSNLVHALKPLCSEMQAALIAEGAAAMIDGLYIRQALNAGATDVAGARALVENYVSMQLTQTLGGTTAS
ncbi:transcriptional regulator BetI [Rhizobium sp. L1K21]|uniref:transcriptional regulator BetI n=1 Tax=Rhizobium sp. L1K21 TaxID=2954933 RepID=UPI0020925DE8|nr:transcriptional regulator BetI [Rhizobium sp. L1K21]MCO6186754.1 transcriptional regulator BetI [Rhizobium sp. L1K21]